MARKSARATKIEPKKIKTFTVVNGDKEIRVMAERYIPRRDSYEEEESYLDFVIDDRNVASFKKWDYVFEEIISSSES